jgi:hypothetical protein
VKTTLTISSLYFSCVEKIIALSRNLGVGNQTNNCFHPWKKKLYIYGALVHAPLRLDNQFILSCPNYIFSKFKTKKAKQAISNLK